MVRIRSAVQIRQMASQKLHTFDPFIQIEIEAKTIITGIIGITNF